MQRSDIVGYDDSLGNENELVCFTGFFFIHTQSKSRSYIPGNMTLEVCKKIAERFLLL